MTSKSRTRSFKEGRIYLDYAASTPVDKDVAEAMKPYFTENFGNPGSTHYFGQKAQAAIDNSREVVAKSIGAKFNEVIFTGSATEANNLALRGVLKAASVPRPRVIVSVMKQSSVLDAAKFLAASFQEASLAPKRRGKEGVEVIYLPVCKEGFVDIESLKKRLTKNTVLVSVIYASNEIGAIQPINAIGKIIKDFRGNNIYPLFHTDAVQAFQFLGCDVNRLGIDSMTLSSQKIYGPKGVGALSIRGLEVREVNKPTKLQPIITGGGQEYWLRSGTENVPAIVGFGKAVELIQKNKNKEAKRIKGLRDYFWRKLRAAKPELELNGPSISSPLRLPNNLSIYFPGVNSQDLLIKFDLNGVSLSAGSACSARSTKASHVIEALNMGEDRARSSLRVSLGRPTNKKDIDTALKLVINLI